MTRDRLRKHRNPTQSFSAPRELFRSFVLKFRGKSRIVIFDKENSPNEACEWSAASGITKAAKCIAMLTWCNHVRTVKA